MYEEQTQTKSGEDRRKQEQSKSLKKFSFEEDAEAGFVTRKIGDLTIENRTEQARATLACSIRLVQPSAALFHHDTSPQSTSHLFQAENELSRTDPGSDTAKPPLPDQTTRDTSGCDEQHCEFYHAQSVLGRF